MKRDVEKQTKIPIKFDTFGFYFFYLLFYFIFFPGYVCSNIKHLQSEIDVLFSLLSCNMAGFANI